MSWWRPWCHLFIMSRGRLADWLIGRLADWRLAHGSVFSKIRIYFTIVIRTYVPHRHAVICPSVHQSINPSVHQSTAVIIGAHGCSNGEFRTVCVVDTAVLFDPILPSSLLPAPPRPAPFTPFGAFQSCRRSWLMHIYCSCLVCLP